jgi:predicted TIM-barrel fold metal-dependent hydrolase
MSMVIDVDSHWTVDWEFHVDRGPLKRFASHFPSEPDLFAFFVAADIMAAMPVEERPRMENIFPERIRPNGERTIVPEHFEGFRQACTVPDRLEWMNRVGIDYSITNGPSFGGAASLIDNPKIRHEFLREANDAVMDEIGNAVNRVGLVTYADLNDLDWTLAELERMRARGSRAFSIVAEPVNGMSLAHPHFDRLWAKLVELGMIVSVHVGLAPALFGDWGRMGGDFNDPGYASAFLRMANSQRYQAAELFLSALTFGGVFDRHPKLTVLIAELYAFWLPTYMGRMQMLTYPNMFGDWPYKRSAVDMLRQQVLVSPLPGLGDVNALQILKAEPDMIVWSSDFPHPEGSADPVALYGDSLATLDPVLREKFLGKSAQQAFVRMGDPLLV